MISIRDVLNVTRSKSEVTEQQGAQIINGLAPLDKAGPGDLTFLSSAKYRRQLASSEAGAVLIQSKDTDYCAEHVLQIVVDDPYLAYARVSAMFDQTPALQGIHETACIDEASRIGTGVAIGAHAVIAAGVTLGNNVEIGPGVVIEEAVTIGSGTRVRANATIMHRCIIGTDCLIQSGTVIGSNGFGYAPDDGRWTAIAQIGRVVIGDRVEIGANCAIDRGALDDTCIEDDVIIDNLVQIAHNVRLGQGTALASQAGVAGSTSIGAGCTVGGQAGFAGHIDIADNSHFTGQAMVTKGTREPGLYSSGLPATTNREWRKMVARLRQLESMQARLLELEKKLSGDSEA